MNLTSKNGKWYVFQVGDPNPTATLQIEDEEIYQLINVSNTFAHGTFINGSFDRNNPSKMFVWNPHYNMLLHMDYIEMDINLVAEETQIAFTTSWDNKNNQAVWYQDYAGQEITNPYKQIPPVAHKFKLPGITPREPLPEFKNGDDVYEWIESQLN